jgi:hypothetical protein
MNERVARLRQKSLDAEPLLSLERAALITEFYRDSRTASVPLLRAQALRQETVREPRLSKPSKCDDQGTASRPPTARACPTRGWQRSHILRLYLTTLASSGRL